MATAKKTTKKAVKAKSKATPCHHCDQTGLQDKHTHCPHCKGTGII